MKTATIDIDELSKLVKKSVEEAFDRKMMELRLQLLPYVSEEEQKEIEELYGEPGDDEVAEVLALERK